MITPAANVTGVTGDPYELVVVGVGADGWPGLTGAAIAALRAAELIVGSERQLELLPGELTAEREAWPSPLLPAVPGLIERSAQTRVVVLASGDPMFHGIGATLRRHTANLRIVPHPSSISLAAARLGWSLPDVDVLSLVTAPVEQLHPLIHPGRRILILSRDGDTPGRVAELLARRGYGDSRLTVLGSLGSPSESVRRLLAKETAGERGPAGEKGAVGGKGGAGEKGAEGVSGSAADGDQGSAGFDPLNVVAVECVAGVGAARRSRVPGLPDDAYDSDGQLTKREVRAVTLAVLGPQPGELLWDVGAGSGSIAIEWMRVHPACRAIAVESDSARAARIVANAAALGVPALRVVEGRAPGVLDGLPAPDVAFIGGGVTRAGLVEAVWGALPSGGRLVANAVTLESESEIAQHYAVFGGELTRVAVSRGKPVGGFTGWHTMMPVTIWSVVKP